MAHNCERKRDILFAVFLVTKKKGSHSFLGIGNFLLNNYIVKYEYRMKKKKIITKELQAQS